MEAFQIPVSNFSQIRSKNSQIPLSIPSFKQSQKASKDIAENCNRWQPFDTCVVRPKLSHLDRIWTGCGPAFGPIRQRTAVAKSAAAGPSTRLGSAEIPAGPIPQRGPRGGNVGQQ